MTRIGLLAKNQSSLKRGRPKEVNTEKPPRYETTYRKGIPHPPNQEDPKLFWSLTFLMLAVSSFPLISVVTVDKESYSNLTEGGKYDLKQ